MTIEVKKQNLFGCAYDRYLAHCISADYALGAGIAVEFQKRYYLRDVLKQRGTGAYPDCILIASVFNLVTKEKYWDKPTYQSLRQALQKMKDIVVKNDIKKIAMPKIGCGLDRLSWPKVREIVESIFADTDIDILVCYM